MHNQLVGVLLVVLTLGFSAYGAYPRLTFSLADVHGPSFSVKAVQIKLVDQQTTRLDVQIGEIVVQERTWRNLNLSCAQFQVTDSLISCAGGKLHLADSISLPILLRFAPQEKTLDIVVNPSADEKWQLSLQWNDNVWQASLAITNGQVVHISKWLSDNEIISASGTGAINGLVKLRGNKKELTKIDANLFVKELTFSDASGLHAGEKINVVINANAQNISRNKQWQWHGDVHWQHGAIFWQPLYFEGNGHRLSLNGTLDEDSIRLLKGDLVLADIGKVDFSGLVTRSDNLLRDFELHADKLELSAVFEQVIKPFLEDTAFSEMNVTGQADIALSYRNGAGESLMLDLQDVSVIDEQERFSFHRVNAHIPWEMERATIADVSILNGHVLHIPLGAVRVPLEINNFSLKVPQLVLPILDGALKIEDFSALRQNEGWQWQLSGELQPLSMDALTEALQVQKMHGTLSGAIPKISYDGTTITVDGTLLFNVFDGTVVAKNLTLLEPLGVAPRLKADLEMRKLDLELLTRTFSFGKVEGRVDMEIDHLELVNWMPTKFDAHLFSSPGNYSRRISQAAIENISALGGAGASAAIQRSVLRFFEEFGYSKIGWRCALRENVCHMGGIEAKSQGYLLVRGGGVPAITVMGYNRDVDWQELINRLKRITQGSDPIIQ